MPDLDSTASVEAIEHALTPLRWNKARIKCLCCADWLFRDCPIGKERALGFRRVLGEVRFVCGTHLAGGDSLIVVSESECALSLYASRWGIEPLFGGLKSRGFDLEATHVSDPVRLMCTPFFGSSALLILLANSRGIVQASAEACINRRKGDRRVVG